MAWAATAAYLAIIGILGWRALRGGDTEKVMFVVNVVLLWGSAIWLFGYPALIGPAVFGAGGMLVMLVALTSSDLKVRVPVARVEADSFDPEDLATEIAATEAETRRKAA
ncbi:hypothetical protein [Hoeflea olei]|uniref:Uncharacterized protein n=1 Tax=Hoeflea olei TaxID=1480615 RepID=A0A1C1YX43_9HYPH|nr:hypothetical protein [Hoeflea olei]OCW57980.1 hypothetical protein AWJ14_04130 [Hoeflea olei]